MKYITIHHSAPISGDGTHYIKGKKYTDEEYYKLICRQQLIKNIVLTSIFGVFMCVFMMFRAYVFLEYGI